MVKDRRKIGHTFCQYPFGIRQCDVPFGAWILSMVSLPGGTCCSSWKSRQFCLVWQIHWCYTLARRFLNKRDTANMPCTCSQADVWTALSSQIKIKRKQKREQTIVLPRERSGHILDSVGGGFALQAISPNVLRLSTPMVTSRVIAKPTAKAVPFALHYGSVLSIEHLTRGEKVYSTQDEFSDYFENNASVNCLCQ